MDIKSDVSVSRAKVYLHEMFQGDVYVTASIF